MYPTLLAAAAAITGQSVPLYVPLKTGGERPSEEIIHYRARCPGFDFDLRYSVKRPGGTTVVELDSHATAIPESARKQINDVLTDRFVTSVSIGFCYIGQSGNRKVNLSLLVDAVGQRKAEASKVVLNIEGEKVTVIQMR